MSPTSGFRVFTTLDFDVLRSRRIWEGSLEVDSLDAAGLSRRQHLAAVLRAAREYDALLLNGSGRYDQLAAAALGLRRNGPLVVIADSTWKRGSTRHDRVVKRLGFRAVDSPRVTYCVLSSVERELFPHTWRVDPGSVVFTPFHYTLSAVDLADPVPAGAGVFAGGDSMRDYKPLLEVARRLAVPVTVAAGDASLSHHGTMPPSVEAGRVQPHRFVELLRAAAIVVVPLRQGIERSAGQQTYLNAMALGKVVVATDSPGVRDYVEHGRTGVIVPPADASALEEALGWVLDPKNAERVQAIRRNARELARTQFTRQKYVERLLRVVAAALHADAASLTRAGD